MDDNALIALARQWAQQYFQTDQVDAYLLPIEADDEPEARLVALAIAGFTSWQGCEIWQEAEQPASIYDVGECLPPNGVAWPW